jgi:hypothetical protein
MDRYIETIALAVCGLGLMLNFWIDHSEAVEFDQTIHERIDAAIMQEVSKNNTKLDSVRHRLDSLNIQVNGLAHASIYLDSCQAARTHKSDRAERRGRFVGGLLKGLFPGI